MKSKQAEESILKELEGTQSMSITLNKTNWIQSIIYKLLKKIGDISTTDAKHFQIFTEKIDKTTQRLPTNLDTSNYISGKYWKQSKNKWLR